MFSLRNLWYLLRLWLNQIKSILHHSRCKISSHLKHELNHLFSVLKLHFRILHESQRLTCRFLCLIKHSLTIGFQFLNVYLLFLIQQYCFLIKLNDFQPFQYEFLTLLFQFQWQLCYSQQLLLISVAAWLAL